MGAIYYEQQQVSAAFGMPLPATDRRVSSVYWRHVFAMPDESHNANLFRISS
ncbi:MAG: hypothetical protein ACJA2J_000042 [Candidatus Azotimanducaceae bacterium]|jgi:hypothetical protein